MEHALRAKARQASCCRDGVLPLRGSFGSEDPQCGSGDEVPLKVEGVVNRTVHAEEALGRARRLEPLQLALASSDFLMRILRSVIFPKPLLMPTAQSETSEGGAVGAQLIADQQFRVGADHSLSDLDGSLRDLAHDRL